jgi:serine/threonine protein kinase
VLGSNNYVLRSGVLLSNRYRLEDRVATGGMGDVWRATDEVLGRTVAVKVLLPELLRDPGFLTRFRAEARMMAALHHPGVVRVYDYGEDTVDGDRADYLVMEYVDGEPLSQRIEAAGRLGVGETLSVVAQVADALNAAHLSGIVHRDVKPSNLLVQPDGTVVLVDFGVARAVAASSITSTNAIPGTARYMAPEQAAGRPVSAATDVYALGAVAYHCLAGRPPFTGDNPLEVAVKHLHDQPPALPADLPAPATALVERSLAKDPAARYPTAAALAEAARTALAEPAEAVPAAAVAGQSALPTTPLLTGATRPAPSRGRVPRLAGIAAAVLLALVGLTAALGFGPDRNPSPADAPEPSSSSTVARSSPTAEPERDEPAAPRPVSGSPTEFPPEPTDPPPGGTPSSRPTASPGSSASPRPTPSPTPTPEETEPAPSPSQTRDTSSSQPSADPGRTVTAGA